MSTYYHVNTEKQLIANDNFNQSTIYKRREYRKNPQKTSIGCLMRMAYDGSRSPSPMKKIHWVLPLLVSLALSACSSYSTPNPTPPTVPPPSPAQSSAAVRSEAASTTVSVSIQNFAFSPSSLSIAKGTKVTWTNNDAAPHKIGTAGAFPESSTLSQGQSYSFTFKDAGSY